MEIKKGVEIPVKLSEQVKQFIEKADVGDCVEFERTYAYEFYHRIKFLISSYRIGKEFDVRIKSKGMYATIWRIA